MSYYSFLDELIIAEGIVSELGRVLRTKNSSEAYDVCRQLRNSATRIMRKIKAYDDFREYAEAVAPWTKGVSFLEFDSLGEYRKEQA